MADSMKKNYKISGSGVLCIDGKEIFVLVEDRGTFNLVTVLEDLNDKPVKFSFSYDEEYENAVEVYTETGEVI